MHKINYDGILVNYQKSCYDYECDRGDVMANKLDDIKYSIQENLGRKVIVTANVGRKKTKKREGVITQSYPAVFVVALKDAKEQFDCVSYSYIDILTDSIEIEFLEPVKAAIEV